MSAEDGMTNLGGLPPIGAPAGSTNASDYRVLEPSFDDNSDSNTKRLFDDEEPFDNNIHMPSPGALLFSPKTQQLFYHDEKGTGTFSGSIANLVNSAIGAGILALPFAFQQAGLITSVILALLFCPIISFTLHIMGRAQKLANKGTLQATCGKILGFRAKIIIIVLQLVFITGGNIGFLIIISDNLLPQFQHWFGDDSFISNRQLIIIFALFPITPMCFIQNIQKISPLATFSVGAIVYTLGMMVVRAVLKLNEEGFPDMVAGEISCSTCNAGTPGCATGTDGNGHLETCYDISSFRVNLSVLKAIPVFCFAYNIHCTHSLVFSEMARPKTLTKMDKASVVSLGFCCFVYISCGLVGYWYSQAHLFEDGTVPGNALKIYPPDIDVAIARICIAISVIGSFTSLHFSAFHCFQDLLAKKDELTGKHVFTTVQAVAARLIFIGVCTGVAMAVKDLDIVIDVAGAVAIIPIMFVFPGLLQLRLKTIVYGDESIPFYSLTSNFWGYFLIVFGTVLSISSLIVIILDESGLVDIS